jgi:hypothetical protein
LLYNETIPIQGSARKGEPLIISTITNSTTLIFTTPTFSGDVTLAGILLLVFVLVQKELACISKNPRLQRLGNVVNVVLLPLICIFLLVLVIKVGTVLR